MHKLQFNKKKKEIKDKTNGEGERLLQEWQNLNRLPVKQNEFRVTLQWNKFSPNNPFKFWNSIQIIQKKKKITRPILRPFENIGTENPLKNTMAFAKTYSMNSNDMTSIGLSKQAKHVIKI